MPKVEAWQCPHTKRLFATYDEYVRHMRAYTRKRREAQQKKAVRKYVDERLAEMRKLASFNDIAQWIEENSSLFFLRVYPNDKSKKLPKFRISNVCFDVFWSKQVSNTHHAPIGKPTNWFRDPNLPLGYSGWTGKITFNMVDPLNNWASDYFNGTGINLGSGSGREDAQYEVHVYAADFPNMAVMEKMKGNI